MRNRVAFVSGAASGIARSTCYRLASEGYRIVALDVNGPGVEETARHIRSVGGEAIALAVDVSDSSALATAAASGVGHFGRADVLVHSAGYVDNRPFPEISESDWDRMVAVHLKGAYNSVHAILPYMQENRYGRIVCVSSTSALTGSPNHSHYVAVKAALLGFVRALAIDLGEWGITVNAVLPGPTATPLLDHMDPERVAALSSTPVGRIGTPEDIAHAIAYLVGPEAGYCSGAWLRVSGGV